MHYVKRLASSDTGVRRAQLMDILRQEGIPFAHTHVMYHSNWVENIVVSINPAPRRLVIGAHYDNIEGSTGANDNASGVSVLIKLAKHLLSTARTAIDIVFFDREEYGDRGSDFYVETVGKEHIAAMINLDTCGFGDCITLYTSNEANPCFASFYQPALMNTYHAHRFNYVDNSDFSAFSNAGIDIITITTLMEYEYTLISENLKRFAAEGRAPTKEETKQIAMQLEYPFTMHNQPKDSIESVFQAMLDQVEGYLKGAFDTLSI